MKTTPWVLTLALGLTLCVSARAGEKEKTPAPKNTPAAKGKAVKVPEANPKEAKPEALTGSYVKQRVRRNGHITDGFSQVLVIDAQNSGASDLRQLLMRHGANR